MRRPRHPSPLCPPPRRGRLARRRVAAVQLGQFAVGGIRKLREQLRVAAGGQVNGVQMERSLHRARGSGTLPLLAPPLAPVLPAAAQAVHQALYLV